MEENRIFEEDNTFKQVTTIEQALWHLRAMRGGMKSALNTPNPERDKEDEMLDRVQIEALTLAIDYIRKCMKSNAPDVQSKKEVCDDCISRKQVLDYCQRLIDVEKKQGTDVMNYGQERVNQTEAIMFFVENDYLCPSVKPKTDSKEE